MVRRLGFWKSSVPTATRLGNQRTSIVSIPFASVLSEARKYRLNLTMAHQYLGQAKPAVRDAVFGNAGSLIAFRVGGPDGEVLEQVFRPDMMQSHHFLNL
jgi:hypothetical protein